MRHKSVFEHKDENEKDRVLKWWIVMKGIF